jgi:hypothetical protein
MNILMAPTLREMLLAPEIQPHVVADCQALVEQELSAKSGVSGTAVKLAYKAVNAFAPGYYQSTLEKMLPAMVDQLEPFWADFEDSGGSEFGDYLAKRGNEVSESLLVITDTMARNSERPTVVKAYKTVRGSAGKHIEAALPNLGIMVQTYAV